MQHYTHSELFLMLLGNLRPHSKPKNVKVEEPAYSVAHHYGTSPLLTF
jgi:hypothetical protein